MILKVKELVYIFKLMCLNTFYESGRSILKVKGSNYLWKSLTKYFWFQENGSFGVHWFKVTLPKEAKNEGVVKWDFVSLELG